MSDDIHQHTLPNGSSVGLRVIHDADSTRSSVVCDLCAKLVPRSATGLLTNFDTHRDSGKCKVERRKKQSAETEREAQVARETIVST
jgi:hypothetical protein